jgi:hypothetical protein
LNVFGIISVFRLVEVLNVLHSHSLRVLLDPHPHLLYAGWIPEEWSKLLSQSTEPNSDRQSAASSHGTISNKQEAAFGREQRRSDGAVAFWREQWRGTRDVGRGN